jgi:DNA-binding beta-propeller fold protein YncE
VTLATAAGSAPCDPTWRAAGAGSAACRDGDPTCDADGTADGACTFAVSLCLGSEVTALADCAGATRLAGRGVASVRAAVDAPGGGACSAPAPVRVRLGTRRVLRATVAGGRTRLRLACARARRAGPSRAVVVTTDFETGELATVGVAAPHAVGHPTAPIHSDAVVRTAGGRVYVVNRFLGDNLQVLDPARGLATVLQCSSGPGSNPHDVALVDAHKAYLTRFDRPELWVVDPGAASCAGFLLDTIDLGPWADADGIPEMDQMALVGDRLFVSLERLDRARGFAPAGKSLLAVVDVTSNSVVGTVELSGSNAFGETAGLVREPETGKLVIAEAGNIYRTGDGGLERVDPFALRAEGFFVGETDLGGNVTDFVLVSPTKGYAVLIDDALKNKLVTFDPTRPGSVRRLLVRDQFLPEIALAPDGRLWLADRSLPAPGIRIFDTATDRPLTAGVIDVGLPPFTIAFLP